MPSLARRLWKWTAATLAGLLILLAVGVGLFRAAVPLVPELRAEAEAMAERALGWPVHIGEIDLRWALLGPELVLTDVQLLSPGSREPLVSAARLDIIFGPLDLFQGATPRPSHVRLHRPTLALERGADGELYLSGYALPAAGETRVNWRRLLELGLRHGRLTIIEGELHYRDAVREIDDWTLRLTELTLASDGTRHELDGTLVPPGALGEQIAVGFSANGAPGTPEDWRWKLEFDAADLQLATWYRQLGWHAENSVNGRLGVAGRLSGRGLENVSGNGVLEFADLVFAEAGRLPANFDRVELAWDVTVSEERFQLGVYDLSIEGGGARFAGGMFSLHQGGREYPLEITASRLPLAELAGLAQLLPASADDNATVSGIRAAARELAPRGALRELVLGLAPAADAPQFRIHAVFEDVGISRWKGLPGASGLTGSIQGDETGGTLVLDSRDVRVDLGELFRGPLPAQTLAGEFAWEAMPEGWRILGRNIAVTNPGVDATAALTLDLPPEGSPVIDLVATARDVNLAVRSTWLPVGIMSEGLVRWLDTAILQGKVPEAAVVVRGPLANFPFRDGSGIFDIRFRTEDTAVAYAAGWPRVEGLRADVHFHGPGLDIGIEQARVPGGLTVSGGTARFEDLRESQLEVSANAAGRMTAAWRFLEASPLAKPLGGVLEALDVDGQLRAAVTLDIPLRDTAATTVHVEAGLRDATVHPVALPWTAKALDGTVTVTESAVTGQLAGQLTGHPFTASITAGEIPAGGFATTRIRMQGRSAVDAFEMFLPPAWFARLDGAFDWSGELVLPGKDEGLSMQISSDLQGVGSTLPAPLDAVRPVQVTIALPDEHIDARFDITGLGTGRLVFAETPSGWSFDRGLLAFGETDPVLADAPGLRVEGRVRALDIGALLALDEGAAGGGTSVLRGFDIDAKRLEIGGMTLEDQALRGLRLDPARGGGWDLSLTGPATGRIRMPADDALPWDVMLARLHLPEGNAAEDAAGPPDIAGAIPDPRKLPALKLNIGELRFGTVHLGRVTGELERTAIGYTTRALRAESPSFTLDLDGRWEVVGEEHYTSVTAVLDSRDIGDTLASLGYEGGIDADDGRIEGNLAWHAAPMAMEYGLLEGTVSFEFRDGSLTDVNPGAGRLLGLLSITALPRRLTLDFTDFFSEGLSFDTVGGDFLVTEGNAYTTNVKLEGASVSALLVGRTGLAARDYDQLAIVDPGVSASLPVAGYLAAGPSVGAALLLLSQLLKAPLADITQVKYRITGSWDDPIIKRVQDSNAQKTDSANP